MSRTANKNFNMRELARRLKVSPATISLALNDRPGVSPKTRDWILEEVEKLGYVPSLVGKVINRKHTGMVGMLMPVAGSTLFTRIVDTVNGEIELVPMPLLVSYCQENARVELNMLRIFSQLNLNGIMIATVAGFQNRRIFKQITSAATPVVQVERYSPIIPGDYVGSDHANAVDRCLDELYQQGARSIGIVLNNIDYTTNREIKSAYLAGLEKYGITPNPESMHEVDFSNPTLESEVADFLTNCNGCDALLWCCSASLLRKALAQGGLRRNRKLNLILFDADIPDLPPGRRFVNYIQNGEAIGQKAYELLACWFGREQEFRHKTDSAEFKLPYLRTESAGGPKITA